ncbi:hypothetical protein [Spirulina subsalsa]|uniref:hypothetical protein n=1 Tax=Spirulina subsalsa TaxID=54311 RepID=UPI00030950FB|nr:hypothetical protein [Spirulina subsalsa]
MMSTADQIYELVKSMPEQKSQMVLVFAQFVQNQEEQIDGLSSMTTIEDMQSWRQLVGELAGAWPDFPTAEELRGVLTQDVGRETL